MGGGDSSKAAKGERQWEACATLGVLRTEPRVTTGQTFKVKSGPEEVNYSICVCVYKILLPSSSPLLSPLVTVSANTQNLHTSNAESAAWYPFAPSKRKIS